MPDFPVINKTLLEQYGREAREARARGEKRCCNTSVGVLIRNTTGLYLVIRRMQKPLGYAGVAGHGLDEHDNWIDSMKAELREEAGIIVKNDSDLRLLEHLTCVLTNKCNRPGCLFHACKLFELVVDGTPGHLTGDEGVKAIEWVTRYRLQELCENTRTWYSAGKPEDRDDHMEPAALIHLVKHGVVKMDYSFIDDIRELPFVGPL